MTSVFFSSLALAVLIAAPAMAADVTVAVTGPGGKPVAMAVVTFTPENGAAIPAAMRAAAYTMAQKNIQFQPFVLAIPAGATVSFPNEDRVNHHVYSFSPVQPFQFPLYGHGKSHTMTFPREGTVALGCNIHDSMSAYVRVVATPYFATTGADGRVTLKGVPEGGGRLTVWHPFMDGAGHEQARPVSVAAATPLQTFSVKLQQPAPLTGAY